MKNQNKSLLATVAIVLMLTGSAIAQKGTSVVRRIKFAPGRTTSIQRGSLHRGVGHDFLLKAGAGQTMAVHLAAQGGICFDVYSPGMNDQLANCSKDWSGELPSSGDYRINVLPDTTTEKSFNYTLEITVR
jgi:hypothetical protein